MARKRKAIRDAGAISDFDRSMLDRALRRARRGEGYVEPNPMVGCVIVKSGRVIGEGHHRQYGWPHAEALAIKSCKESIRGATAYVTLEPCCTFKGKKTPACVDALIAARIKRVVAGVIDPNPGISGSGLRRLRSAGIDVTVIDSPDMRGLIAPFRRYVIDHRPYVIAKWAQSLDGRLAASSGDSKWISGEESRRLVHELRARVDAVVVGVGTVLQDDPILTARDVRVRRVAARVVVDSQLRTPLASKLVQSVTEAPVVVFTSHDAAKSRKADQLRSAGVEVIPVDSTNKKGSQSQSSSGSLALDECLNHLHGRRFTNVLVEGGPTLLTSFFRAGLVDEALVFVAPMLLGGDSRMTVVSSTALHMTDAVRPAEVSVKMSGKDVCYRFRLQDT